MGPIVGPHLLEPELEAYSMGTLSDDRMGEFEEHLLACAGCQDRLLEMESFVNAVRSVSPKLREAKPPFGAATVREWLLQFVKWPRVAVVVAFAATVAVLLLALPRGAAPPERAQMAALTLQASRGMAAAAQAPAGTALSLTVDLTELTAFASYKLAIVGSTGAAVWESEAFPEDHKLTVPMTKGLSAGQYYVRLSAPGGELLREFSLAVK